MTREQIKQFMKRFLYPVPSHLSKRQLQIDKDALHAVRESIQRNYHTGWRSQSNYSKEGCEKDRNAHLHKRLDLDRMHIIPWLDNAKRLENSNILEIGCGTGSSTVALAEQGAIVTGIDIDAGALSVAKDRCRVYGLEAEFKMLNATDIMNVFSDSRFDFIIFFACLEHMTIEERLSSLKDSWELLQTNGLLVIVEMPNRLWYFDLHTSWLPFFHWLPDELAFKYSRFSQRENFRDLYREYDVTSKQNFLRRGRGVSFHEIDLSIKPVSDLRIVSSLSGFEGIRYNLRFRESRFERRYKSFMRTVYPNVHPGFFDMNLDIIIEKD